MKNKKGNIAPIAIIIVIVLITVGVLVYMFTGKTQTSSQKDVVQDATQKQQVATQSLTAQKPSALLLDNIYKSDKYSFTINYPSAWKISEKYGINFMPVEKNEEDFLPEKINKEKDCAINISVLSVQKDTSIVPCKTKLSDVIFGSNKFVKCFTVNVQDNSEGYDFRMIHPKKGNLINVASVANNTSCNSILEGVLETLSF